MSARPTPAVPPPADAPLSLAERGRAADGAPLALDRRLFLHLLVFDGAPADLAPLAAALTTATPEALPVEAVLYADAHHPRGAALLTWAEDPAAFTGPVRAFVGAGPFAALALRPERTLVGRTYTIGYESDLADALVGRPRRRLLDDALAWHLWYPVRRAGAFARLDAAEQRAMLMEHGAIGRRFGEAGHAHDVRLAAHGLDTDDADFVVGITAPTLTGASALVQAMRATRQTAEYLDRLGPFFVGHVAARRRL